MKKQTLTNEILLSLFETLKRKCTELQDTEIVIEEGKRGNTYSFKRNAKGGGTLSLNFSNEEELQHIVSFFGLE